MLDLHSGCKHGPHDLLVLGAAAAVPVPANQEDIELADEDEEIEAAGAEAGPQDPDIQLQQQTVPVRPSAVLNAMSCIVCVSAHMPLPQRCMSVLCSTMQLLVQAGCA